MIFRAPDQRFGNSGILTVEFRADFRSRKCKNRAFSGQQNNIQVQIGPINLQKEISLN